MANWQAPNSHNQGDVSDQLPVYARPYLDSTTGRVKWWTGGDPLPVGSTPLYIVLRTGDGYRVVSDDSANERKSLLFGSSHIIIW